MQPIAFCTRCRGMKVGWNTRYVVHRLLCRRWRTYWKTLRLSALTAAVSLIIIGFPAPAGIGFAGQKENQVQNQQPSVMQAALIPVLTPSPSAAIASAVSAIDSMLARYDVDGEKRNRVARAIVTSSRKYNLDPRLVASVMIVESRADPHAISERHSIGLMQIHLATWGPIADKQGINLFKIEDNVDLGARILKGYIGQYGLWEGVAHYTGCTDTPESRQTAGDYVRKVQKVYGFTPPED